jgi:hypothetical protein
VILSWPGSSVSVTFKGTAVKAILQSGGGWYKVILDGEVLSDLNLGNRPDKEILLADNLTDTIHTVELFKRNEALVGEGLFIKFSIYGNPHSLFHPPPADLRIEFIGNSITCGYGNLDSVKERGFSPATQDFWHSYSSIAGRNLHADVRGICWSGKGVYQNNTGDKIMTLPLLWEKAVPTLSHAWNHKSWIPHAVIINLGTNDFAIHRPDSTALEKSYAAFIQRILDEYGDIPIVLLDGPMLSDHWPLDTVTNKPVPTLSLVRQHLENLKRQFLDKGKKVHHLSLTPNSFERGYGADWHPNQLQHILNAREITDFLLTNP